MKSFQCRVCGNPLHFENSVCVSCGSRLGFSRVERTIVPVDDRGRYVDANGRSWWICRNLSLCGCTWLSQEPGGQCTACDLTRTRPADADVEGIAQFTEAERAKRQLVVELDTLGLPVLDKGADPVNGLAFDLLSTTEHSGATNVVIGHEDGVITIDLAESDDAYREKVRARLDEPYRTMLGHFRHEVGHYFEWQLIRGDERITRKRALFGDERTDYQEAIQRHYSSGPPAGWEEAYISTYATMHPFEDFAETWAHYLHICDAIETAGEYGLTTVAAPQAFSLFADLVAGVWIPLSLALNMVNRSMGKDDLYPFVIPPRVVEKLEFVASLAPR